MSWFKKFQTHPNIAQQELTPEQALRALSKSSIDKGRQKKLAQQWRDRILRSHSMTPGTAATTKEFVANHDAEYKDSDQRSRTTWIMSGKECKVFLTQVFGAPTKIEADVGTCHIWSFDFEGATFMANWRSAKGLGWEWVNQEDLPREPDAENCRSYGRPMLLSHDKESPAAWRNFCKMLAQAHSLGPAHAQTLMEAFSIEDATPESAARSKRPRC